VTQSRAVQHTEVVESRNSKEERNRAEVSEDGPSKLKEKDEQLLTTFLPIVY